MSAHEQEELPPVPSILDRDLGPADFEVLEFARAWWKYPGRKEAVILERFGISGTRYTQRLMALLDHPQAMAYDPDLVRRLKGTTVRRRAARLSGFESIR